MPDAPASLANLELDMISQLTQKALAFPEVRKAVIDGLVARGISPDNAKRAADNFSPQPQPVKSPLVGVKLQALSAQETESEVDTRLSRSPSEDKVQPARDEEVTASGVVGESQVRRVTQPTRQPLPAPQRFMPIAPSGGGQKPSGVQSQAPAALTGPMVEESLDDLPEH